MNRIKDLRIEQGLTQQELADEIGVPCRTLQNWENELSPIRLAAAYELAVYFGVDMPYLFGYSDVSDHQRLDKLIKGIRKVKNRQSIRLQGECYIPEEEVLALVYQYIQKKYVP